MCWLKYFYYYYFILLFTFHNLMLCILMFGGHQCRHWKHEPLSIGTTLNVCRHGFVSKWFICYLDTYLIDSIAFYINQIIHRPDWIELYVDLIILLDPKLSHYDLSLISPFEFPGNETRSIDAFTFINPSNCNGLNRKGDVILKW